MSYLTLNNIMTLWVRGHSRSFKLVPFESFGVRNLIVTMIFSRLCDIQRQRMAWLWNLG